MTEPTALGDLELAALVSSRICHDVINPVSAIANGLEMLAEGSLQEKTLVSTVMSNAGVDRAIHGCRRLSTSHTTRAPS